MLKDNLSGKEAAEWVRDFTGESVRAVALRLGEDASSFDKKVKRGLTADLVIDIADAYDLDPVTALVDTGHLPISQHDEDLLEKMSRLTRELKEVQQQLENERNNVSHIRSTRPEPVTPLNYDEHTMAADSSPDEDKQKRGDDTDQNLP